MSFFNVFSSVVIINFVELKAATLGVAAFSFVMVRSCNTYQTQPDALSY